MKRRRRISFGSIAMVLIACITLSSAFSVILTIRKDEGDLAMDAEKLFQSVGGLITMSRRHIAEDFSTLPQTTNESTGTTVYPQSVQASSSSMPEHSVSQSVATPPPAMSNKHSLSLTFGGLIALESAVQAGIPRGEGGVYRYSELLGGISSAVHADMNIAVLDTLFTSDKTVSRDLFASADCIQTITAAGFDTLMLCTEDALAGGRQAVSETLQTLSANGIISSGLYLPETANNFDLIQVNGIHVALLSYTDSLSSYSRKAVQDVEMQQKMIHLFDQQQALKDIAAAKASGAQVILVFMNWGDAAATESTSSQQAIAQALCDGGADILLGYNSCHVQPVDMLTSSVDPSHRMITVWSLGTLLAEDRSSRGSVSGALLHVQLSYDMRNNTLSFDSVEYTPTYIWRQEERGSYPYRVVRSDQSVPEGMIQKQREILARALVLIQSTMNKGIAVQR